MTNFEKHITEFSPQELNSYLNNKYKIGLHPLAITLRHILAAGDIYKLKTFPPSQILIDLKKKLQNLKKKIEKTLIDCEKTLSLRLKSAYIREKPKSYASKEQFEEKFKIKEFFKLLDSHIQTCESIIRTRVPGTPIKTINLIASLWGHLFKEVNDKIDWDIIAYILDWYWERLKNYKFYKILNPENKMQYDPAYLKNQFYRNIKRTYDIYKMNYDLFFKDGLSKINSTVIFREKSHSNIDYTDLRSTYRFAKEINLVKPLEIGLKKILVYRELPDRIENIHSTEKPTNNEWDIFYYLRDFIYDFFAAKLYKDHPFTPPLIIFPDFTYL